MNSITLDRNIASNGLAYHATGTGTPVVLVHGVGLRAESFSPQIEFLKQSHNVYAIDLPGHGHSRGVDKATRALANYTATLKVFIDEVIGEPAVLVGHSMGAMIALDFASHNPDQCMGAASLNAIYRRSEKAATAVKQRAADLWQNPGGDVASAPIARWFGEDPCGLEFEIAAACRDWLTQVDGCAYAAAYSVFANDTGLSDAELAKLQQPHLFLTGAEDENSTAEMSLAMAKMAPKGEAVIISGARHLAQLTHADKVNVTLGDFIARCEAEVSCPPLARAGGR